MNAKPALQGAIAARAKEISIDLGGGIKLEMLLIPAGRFLMGSPDSDPYADRKEKPQHWVRITKPFYLGKYPVTQEQWQVVVGDEPSHFKGPKKPVENISWNDCQAFLTKLNTNFATSKSRFALPTEAQWEYGCRAGSTTRYFFSDEESLLDKYAWYLDNADDETHPVGKKSPNAWGLHDMYGNVQEWCADWYAARYYEKSPMDDPLGPAEGVDRVVRGSDWMSPGRWCRSAIRGGITSTGGGDCLGFRVSLVLE